MSRTAAEPSPTPTPAPGYAARARHYANEISQCAPPATLAGLLQPGLRVAEMPSGTGHFLPAYTAAAATIILVDSCDDMLRAARAHAIRLGTAPEFVCSPIQNLTQQAGPFDLIVMPNAALNQLTADTGPTELLTATSRPLRPGGRLLAQVLDLTTGGACGFYDPGLADGSWQVDREFTDGDGQPVTRRRHQRADTPPLIDIGFELRAGAELLCRHHITLRLLSIAEMEAALTAAGYRDVTASPGPGGFIELLATRAAK